MSQSNHRLYTVYSMSSIKGGFLKMQAGRLESNDRSKASSDEKDAAMSSEERTFSAGSPRSSSEPSKQSAPALAVVLSATAISC